MAKRGESGLSFVVGIDKPTGLTSHDVVNRCRRLFGEKRIGHTGTLDPLASGAMAVCVGPATKLSAHLTFHDKEYVARIVFGAATATDDAEGEVLRTAAVPAALAREEVAQGVLDALVGEQNQMPPAFSAKKVGGVKSYEAARKGSVINLAPRAVRIDKAQLMAVGRTDEGALYWDTRFAVSAGTYIRSIARDVGLSQGTCAHLGALRRLRSGLLAVGECVSLEALEENSLAGRIDPVRLLGLRYAAANSSAQRKAVANGAALSPAGLALFQMPTSAQDGVAIPHCTPQAVESRRALASGEVLAVLVDNTLAALYKYDGSAGCLKSQCGFAQGVSRGSI